MKDSWFAGIEIGGTKLQIAFGDAKANVHSTHQFRINASEGAASIRKIIQEVLDKQLTDRTAAIGVGFGGPVNHNTGQVSQSFHVEGWSDFKIPEWIQSFVDIPVFVDNDANVAALGEAVYGIGKQQRSILYITLGSGIGGGFVVNKKIDHGAVPGEVEIGHLRLDRSGNTLESLCAGWAVDRKIRDAIKEEPSGVLATLAAGQSGAEARFLNAAIEAGDAKAIEIFESTTEDLAYGISHAVHLMHPDMVILGGGLSLMGELFRDNIEKKLPRWLMSSFLPCPPIQLSQLKEMAVPVGALVMAGEYFYRT